jgi:hypothetical protein
MCKPATRIRNPEQREVLIDLEITPTQIMLNFLNDSRAEVFEYRVHRNVGQ